MAVQIHPTALVDAKAQIGVDVTIGPFTIVGEHVVIGDRTQIGAHKVIEGHTRIGSD